MFTHCKSASILGMLLFLLSANAALSSDGIKVKIMNDTSSNVVVTVIDMNATPEQVVVSNETIYAFASHSIQISPDSRGYGHVRWTANSGDAGNRTCGQKERNELSADDVVHVRADSSCHVN
jgi:hypothetical protein